ncbi:hypothetical protein PHMEG_00025953 [Phytophthora megakarya]|uniref:Uncharacterized protein n=1 Tax=Phytophthora megakarya TaxID=4795 RepID=A0A225VCH2_9STRA|nr:hypothetical protein PHMEG_00025953 [Phytophthora megakarya]
MEGKSSTRLSCLDVGFFDAPFWTTLPLFIRATRRSLPPTAPLRLSSLRTSFPTAAGCVNPVPNVRRCPCTRPATGDYVPSITVDGLVQDVTALEHETHVLRRRLELSTALNAGLAAHASILHDRIDAQHDRARVGYDLGVALVARLYGEIDGLRGEETRLRERVQDLRALNAEDWADRYRGLENSSYENACRLQDALIAAQARLAELTAQLASFPAPSASTTDAPGVEAAARNAAVSTSSVTQTAARDELAVTRTAHVPLQTNLRRVNALLVAHAEEHQRDVTCIRDLEEAVSVAETARLTAQAELTEAHEEVQLSLIAQTSSALLYYRRNEGEVLPVQLTSRLTASERTLAETRRESEARGIIDDSDRTYNDRTATWRRLIREGLVGCEIARRVRDALTSRLSTMLTSIGGTMDSAALVRSLEASMEAALYAAVPLPPDLDPVTGQPPTSETTLSDASAVASLREVVDPARDSYNHRVVYNDIGRSDTRDFDTRRVVRVVFRCEAYNDAFAFEICRVVGVVFHSDFCRFSFCRDVDSGFLDPDNCGVHAWIHLGVNSSDSGPRCVVNVDHHHIRIS